MNSWLSPEQINRIAADPANRTRSELPLEADLRRPFMPEHLTQLYFTPHYASLHFEHRLRYNQLFALRTNEFIMMFEADLVEQLLEPLKRHERVAGDRQLIDAIDTMIEEERRHYRLFASFNRSVRPDLYPAVRDRYFSRTPVWTKAMFWTAGALASRLAFAMWYLMAMEESSMDLPRQMQRKSGTETLGELDPAFVALHVEHMKDEARHVHIDGRLIDLVIGAGSPRQRRLNARIFRAMLPSCIKPTRGGSGAKVIRQLVREMPELRDREEQLIRGVVALRDNRDYQQSLFNRRIMPMTFRLFDSVGELAGLERELAGYDRR